MRVGGGGTFVATILAANLLVCAAAVAQTAPVAATSPADLRAEYDSLFRQVLANPADVNATVRFAELASQLGDYEAAIGAYERLLFFYPGLANAKIELGVLYFRLGSYAASKSYFEAALEAEDLADEYRSRIDAYIAEIDRRLSPTRFTLYLHSGVRYQTNATAGPGSSIVRIGGSDAVLDSIFAKQEDWNWFGLAAANYTHDFGNQRGDAFEATLGGYYSRQFELHRFNLGAVELQAGPRLALFPEHIDGYSVKYYGIGNAVSLADKLYYWTYGGGVTLRYQPGPVSNFDGTVESGAEYRNRKFYDSANFPASSGQTGELFVYFLTATGKVTPNLNWQFRAAYEHNSADLSHHSYRRISIDAGFPYTFTVPVAGASRRWVFTPYGGFSRTEYRSPDPAVDPGVTREDEEWRTGATLDAEIVKNAGIRVNVNFSSIRSNIINYTTDNFSVLFGPAARF